MSYKTVLMHLNRDQRANQVLAAGVQIANAFNAHLIGLRVFPAFRLRPPIPLPIGQEVLGAIAAQVRDETARIKTQFDDATGQQQFVSEWRSVTTERRDPAEIIMEHGRAADLIIASQADPNWDLSPILDFPDQLALGSGRPVLVVPTSGVFQHVPKTITVAWNGRREAARAVSDAMPLLKRADRVYVLTVASEPREGGLPDTEIAATLARHGVKVSVNELQASDSAAGEEIARRAAEQSELLVMGAYGRSRFSEFILGGVTRHMLKSMTIPVLFSH
ncbi:universal stress protein [Leptospira interrogans]